MLNLIQEDYTTRHLELISHSVSKRAKSGHKKKGKKLSITMNKKCNPSDAAFIIPF